jgi:hypothetical protein
MVRTGSTTGVATGGESQVAYGKADYSSILDTLPVAAGRVASATGEIRYVNPALAAMFGPGHAPVTPSSVHYVDVA